MENVSHEDRIASWKNIIDKARSSGLSARAWCIENGISPHQFYYWRNKCSVANATLGTESGRISEQASITRSLSSRKSKKENDVVLTGTHAFAELDMSVLHSDAEPNRRQSAESLPAFLQPEIMIRQGECTIILGKEFSESNLEKVMRAISHV